MSSAPASQQAAGCRSWSGSTAAASSPARATTTTRARSSPHGVIVVTINYRLGALGFLAHPALADKPGRPDGRLRPDGPAGGPALGAAQHRGVRRQPGQRHDLRRVGGRPERAAAARLARPRAGCSPRPSPRAAATPLDQAPLATRRGRGRAFAAKAGCASQTAAVPAQPAGGHHPGRPGPVGRQRPTSTARC